MMPTVEVEVSLFLLNFNLINERAGHGNLDEQFFGYNQMAKTIVLISNIKFAGLDFYR